MRRWIRLRSDPDHSPQAARVIRAIGACRGMQCLPASLKRCGNSRYVNSSPSHYAPRVATQPRTTHTVPTRWVATNRHADRFSRSVGRSVFGGRHRDFTSRRPVQNTSTTTRHHSIKPVARASTSQAVISFPTMRRSDEFGDGFARTRRVLIVDDDAEFLRIARVVL